MTSFLTIEEAAERAHCERPPIRRAIRNRELEALYGSRWLVPEGALED